MGRSPASSCVRTAAASPVPPLKLARSAQHGITERSAPSAPAPKSWRRTASVSMTIASARRIATLWTHWVSRYGSPPRFQLPASTYSSAISPRRSKIRRHPVSRLTISAIAAGTWLRAWIACSRCRRMIRIAVIAPASVS